MNVKCRDLDQVQVQDHCQMDFIVSDQSAELFENVKCQLWIQLLAKTHLVLAFLLAWFWALGLPCQSRVGALSAAACYLSRAINAPDAVITYAVCRRWSGKELKLIKMQLILPLFTTTSACFVLMVYFIKRQTWVSCRQEAHKKCHKDSHESRCRSKKRSAFYIAYTPCMLQLVAKASPHLFALLFRVCPPLSGSLFPALSSALCLIDYARKGRGKAESAQRKC